MRLYKEGGFICDKVHRHCHSLASPFTVFSADWPQAWWAPSCWSLTDSAFNASTCLHDHFERLTKKYTCRRNVFLQSAGKNFHTMLMLSDVAALSLSFIWPFPLRGLHSQSSTTISTLPSARATTAPCTTASWLTEPISASPGSSASRSPWADCSAPSLWGCCVIKDV